MNLTTNFTLEEMIYSEFAIRNNIDNTPDEEIIDNLYSLCIKLEAVRSLFDKPLIISSGYRCSELNYLIGGTAGSAHQKGLAADFIVKDNHDRIFEDCKIIAENIYVFGIDQLIFEQRWIHVGLPNKDSAGSFNMPRCQMLTAMFENRRVRYVNGLVR